MDRSEERGVVWFETIRLVALAQSGRERHAHRYLHPKRHTSYYSGRTDNEELG